MTQFSANDLIVILSYARTPMGGMQGVFSDVSATDLGRDGSEGRGRARGRRGRGYRADLHGLRAPRRARPGPRAAGGAQSRPRPSRSRLTTVNKVCGSGMQTVIMGSEALASGSVDVVVAGGMESMTNAPYLLKKHRSARAARPRHRL